MNELSTRKFFSDLTLHYQNYDEVDIEPRIIELHGDRVNIFEFIHKTMRGIYPISEQIYDKYHWLEEDSDRRETQLSFEEYTLQKYLKLNACKNDWLTISKLFHDAADHELFSDVQYLGSFIFYSYLDFSRGIDKPWV